MQSQNDELDIRVASFFREIEKILACHGQLIAAAARSGSPAHYANAIVQQALALADARDRLHDAGMRSKVERDIKAAWCEIQRQQLSKAELREKRNELRLAVVAAAYEQQLIASEALEGMNPPQPHTLPDRPGMESAYRIGGNLHALSMGFENLSAGAVERLRYRMAKRLESQTGPQWVRFDAATLTFYDSDGFLAEVLERLPKKRGRPRRSGKSDSK